MIFITGCARSGTSLTSKILKAHGCFLGPEKRINSLFENTNIREKVIKAYLRSIGADPLGQHPLAEKLRPLPEFREEVIKYMGGNPPEPWAYKCAKLAPLWPLWKDAFPEAKYVIVRRDKDKIAESCLRTPFMRAFNGKEGWLEWVAVHERKFDEMRVHLDTIDVWTDEVVKDPAKFQPVAEFCGLNFDEAATRAAIDPNAWH